MKKNTVKITDTTTQPTSVDENPNSSTFGDMSKNVMEYSRTAVEGTPFIKHRSETNGWALGIAEHKITGWYKTEKEVDDLLNGRKPNWDFLTGVILVLIQKERDYQNLNQEIERRQKNEN